jgi:hypothetical protein
VSDAGGFLAIWCNNYFTFAGIYELEIMAVQRSVKQTKTPKQTISHKCLFAENLQLILHNWIFLWIFAA